MKKFKIVTSTGERIIKAKSFADAIDRFGDKGLIISIETI